MTKPGRAGNGCTRGAAGQRGDGLGVVAAAGETARTEELQRLRHFTERPGSGLAVVYGRRRCGKTRLVQQAASTGGAAYYMADDRDATLQRSALAVEIARVLPGFADVRHPEWSALLERLWREAGDHFCLIIDELPALVASARELPSLLQKLLDRPDGRGPVPIGDADSRLT